MHDWTPFISGAVALAAIILAGIAVTRVKESTPARAALLITALAGFVTAMVPLVESFATLQG